MLAVEKVADLQLRRPEGATDTPRIEAASGLAIVGETVYVIADDEAYLALFPGMARRKGTTVQLLDVDVPSDESERKAHKPDLESLTPLSGFGRFPNGGLIALPSGSSGRRHHGAFAILESGGLVRSAVQLDCAPLMEELSDRIPELNLEGTAVAGEVLRILQLGNDPHSYNAHIDVDLGGVLDAIERERPLRGELIASIQKHDLGQLHGTRLCFSDADTLPDGRIVFSASAETEGDGVDGRVVGSAVGLMQPNGEVLSVDPVDVETKVEGLAATLEGRIIHAYMVSDQDDPARPSALLRTVIRD